MQFIYPYASPLGGMTLASDGKNLTGLWFDGQKYFGKALAQDCHLKKLPVFEQTLQWLDIYFSKNAPDFTPPLSMEATPFCKSVWEILLAIPFGQTMTYGEIARQLAAQKGTAMSAQAVGGAAGRNPVALIVPCHRVTGAKGRLTGYAGGLDKKAWLLAMESGETSV